MRTSEEDVTGTEEAETETIPDQRDPTGDEERDSEGILDGVQDAVGSAVMEVKDVLAEVNVGFVRKSALFLYNFIDVFVGVCFVAMAFFIIFVMRDYGASYRDLDITDWLSQFAMLFGGALLIFNPRRTFNTSIGIYAMIMGTVSFCGTWSSMSEPMLGESSGFLGFFDDIIFIFQLVMLTLAGNLIYSGTSYLRGRPRGTIGMMAKAMLMLAYNLLALLLTISAGEIKNIGDAFRMDSTGLIQIVMFIIFLNMMDTEDARRYNTKNRLSRSTEALRHTKTLDEKSYMLYEDAVILSSRDFSGWERVTDGGPAELEYRFAIQTTGGASYITVQRWRGHDCYYLTITDHERGTNIRATRMSVDALTLSEDGNVFSIVGMDHFSVNVNVRHPIESMEVVWRRKA